MRLSPILPKFDSKRDSSSIGASLAWWAGQNRGPAFTFISDFDSEGRNKTLSYEELHRRACSIAIELKKKVADGDRVLLWYEPGLEFVEAFWACIYAGVVAVPAICPDSLSLIPKAMPRLQAICQDCGAHAILTSSKIIESLNGTSPLAGIPLGLAPCIATDSVPTEIDPPQPPIDWPAEKLALLQYTSGSTGMPRGVMVSHGNLVANQRMIFEAMPPWGETKDISVGWLPFHHDMGLIGNVVQSVYRGAHGHVMAPIDFVRRPLRWLNAISRYRATISGGPNFAYELCVHRLTPEHLQGLDLSSWRLAFCGAEPIRESALRRFAKLLEPTGFKPRSWLPVYGLAEATLLVSGVRPAHGAPLAMGFAEGPLQRHQAVPDPSQNAPRLVGCGAPPAGLDVRIVDPETTRLRQPGEIGEIWVAGPSVCTGYWKKPELTERDFQACIHGEETHYLRTGDLGFLFESNLFVTGRLKDLIIIRGRNHYPSDIELTVEGSHPNISSGRAIAFSIEQGGNEILAIVAEVSKMTSVEPEEVIEAVQDAVVKNHAITAGQIILVRPGTVPKTSSGKLQRARCKKMLLSGEIDSTLFSKSNSIK